MSDDEYRTTPYSGISVKRDVRKHLPPNVSIDKIRCTLFGDLCIQSFTAFFLWEKVFSDHSFQRFIEIGAGFGGTSLFFLLWCKQRGALYYGYERFKKRRNAHRKSALKSFVQMENNMSYIDVFNEDVQRELAYHISSIGQTILFCDGSDKVHEFRTFAPYLKTGDIIAAHDWPRAVNAEWVKDTIEDCHLEQIFAEDCRKIDTHTAWFIKGGIDANKVMEEKRQVVSEVG